MNRLSPPHSARRGGAAGTGSTQASPGMWSGKFERNKTLQDAACGHSIQGPRAVLGKQGCLKAAAVGWALTW